MVPEGWRFARIRDLKGADCRPVTKLGPFGSSIKKSDYRASGYKVYGQQQVLAGDQDFGDYWIDEEKYKELSACSVQPGDILLSTMGSFGSVLCLKEDCKPGIINPRLLRLSISKEIAHPSFIEYFLKSDLAQRQFLAFAQGGTMQAVNGASINALEIPLPPLAEQKQIAEVLRVWDRAIAVAGQQLDLARTQKRALMQTLLTPTRRFPGFEGQPWTEVRLGDVVYVSVGKAKRDELEDDGDKLVLDMGAVSRNGEIVARKRTNSLDDLLMTGDLVMPKDDIGGGNIIGKVVLVQTNDQYVLGDHVYLLRVKSANRVLPDFLRYQINSEQVNRTFRRKANGTAQLGLGRKDVETQGIQIPSLAEQQAIAEVLNDAQTEITTLETQITRLQAEKKALMQQLLTGKKRIKV